MRFSLKSSNCSAWKKRFAILPVCVSVDDKGVETYAVFESYETRTYHKKDDIWVTETRLPGSSEVVKKEIDESANSITDAYR